jgi:hypothetical protein
MSEGLFKYEDCLLKHHVRLNGWLPLCKKRRQQINSGKKHQRRLRYFTFCAVGAIDVLMLDVAKVLIKSQEKTFDTVYFFDRDATRVFETRKRIPGANGFVGDFTDTVLAEDLVTLEEESKLDKNEKDPLSSAQTEKDTELLRQKQRKKSVRSDFIKSFPFDIINLDLEEFLFKPNDPMPGKVINAPRNVFSWQHRRRPLFPRREAQAIDGFSLMFTTRVGPPNLSEEYLEMLRNSLATNLDQDVKLRELLRKKTGQDDICILQNSSFDHFFKLAVPKVLANALMEKDWYIDPGAGIKLYEFDRSSESGPYKMLHLVMDVIKHHPPESMRASGSKSQQAQNAYRSVVRQLFSQPEIVVDEASIDKPKLQKDLNKIKGRRKKYCQDD